MKDKVTKAFANLFPDREIIRIALISNMGVDGCYLVSAPIKDSDNLYEPCTFLFSINTNKAKLIVPTDNIGAYTELMENSEEIWSKY